MHEIDFNSDEEYYEYEEADLKNNTARFTDDWTERRWQEYDRAEWVHIHSTGNKIKSFRRRIRHKCRIPKIR